MSRNYIRDVINTLVIESSRYSAFRKFFILQNKVGSIDIIQCPDHT